MSEWTDPDGNSLGEWEEIPREEYWEIFKRERDDLTVFSTLTDPEGNYGIRQIYTAWGYKEEDVPLIDIRDYKTEDGGLERQICRKFVSATCPNREAVSRPSTEDSGLSIDSPENKKEARNQGDFLGDDLSGEHSCHAGCPCHSGQSDPQCPDCGFPANQDGHALCPSTMDGSPSVPDEEAFARCRDIRIMAWDEIRTPLFNLFSTPFERDRASDALYGLIGEQIARAYAAGLNASSLSPGRETGCQTCGDSRAVNVEHPNGVQTIPCPDCWVRLGEGRLSLADKGENDG